MNLIYNSNFFNEFYDSNGGGNYTDKVKWMPFFNSVAEEIIKRYNPKTVLDAGCALGYIVEALRDRGVEAYGFDISEYAIAAVREDIKPYCMVHSITEPLPETFPQKFDMVITLEVLEHLFPEEAEKAIKNLCQYTDMIIFSSTSSDILDRTHVNVQQPEYWSKGFAQSMFFRELEQDMRFISPWATLYTRKDDLSKVIFNYEMNMRIDNMTKGYGFIKSEDGKEVFVHYSNVNKKGYRVLYQDEIVDFEIGTNSDGREQAVNVAPILTIKMIESALKKENLFLQSMKDAYGVKKYLIVDLNNVLQTSEYGMTVDELIDYLNEM